MDIRFRPLIALAVAALLSACTQFPELDRGQTPGVAEAPYPNLVPLDSLLDGPAPRADQAMIGQTLGRAGALRARADRLQRMRGAAPAGLSARVARLQRKAEALRQQ